MMNIVSIYLGLSEVRFTTGISIDFSNISFSYAFAVDKIDSGYNNIVSLTVLF